MFKYLRLNPTPVFEAEGAKGTPPATPPAGGSAAPWGSEGVWNVGEGEAAKPWYSFIGDEAAREHVAAKGYATPSDLAVANFNLTKLQRGDPTVVGVPGADASPEDMQAFYNKLGRPESAEGYEFKFGEDVKVDDATMSFARTAFHEAGLTPAQAQKVADSWNAFQATQVTAAQEASTEANTAALTALQTKWGGELDANKAAGKRVIDTLGLSDETMSAVENNIGAAGLIELLAMIGRKSDEGGLIGGGQGDPSDPAHMTKETAQAEIDRLTGDADFQAKYTSKTHPEHEAAVKRMAALYAKV